MSSPSLRVMPLPIDRRSLRMGTLLSWANEHHKAPSFVMIWETGWDETVDFRET
jgi:hypothetical protein